MNEVFCFILCFGFGGAAGANQPAQVDSFCSLYEQVVLNQGDLVGVRKLSPEMSKRLQANELLFLCHCKGWKDAACERVKRKR